MTDFIMSEDGTLTEKPAPPPRPPARPLDLPGSTPGGLQPNPDAPPEAMIPESPGVAHARNLMNFGAIANNRAAASAGATLYSKDPSIIARDEQAKKAGESANAIADKQSSGTQMIGAIRALMDRVYSLPESTWKASFGPENAKPMSAKYTLGWYRPSAWMMPDMPGVEARQMFWGNDPRYPQYAEAYETWNAWKHLVDAATEGLLGTGTKVSAGSDARMEVFRDMIGRTENAPNRAAAVRILHDAEDQLRRNSYLQPRPGSIENPVNVATRQDFSALGIGDYFRTHAPGPDGHDHVLQKPYILPANKVPNSGQIRALHAHPEMAESFMREFGISPETLRAKYLPNYQPPAPANLH